MSIINGNVLMFGKPSSDGGAIFAAISVIYPEGSTCTATNGTKTLTASDTSGEYIFSIPEPESLPETWTISCTDGIESSSATVTISELGQIESITLPYRQIYGASWDGTSTTAWIRTDASANFTDPVPYVSGASSYGSPFDNLSPWKDVIRVTDSAAGEMVKIPKFWYKLSQNGSGLSVQISPTYREGFYVCPACMNRGDGKGEREYILIGRYHCVSDYKSKANVVPKVNETRSSFRSGIKNLGTGIYMMDFAARFTIWLLYIVEFANWDSQAKIGYGCGNGSTIENMGYTDNMPYHTGTTQSIRTTYGVGTQYRCMEGLWDNVWDWTDGCYYNTDGLNIIINPENASDDSGGVLIGKPATGVTGNERYPTRFSIVSPNLLFPTFIPIASGGTGSTYSSDAWSYNGANPCLRFGGCYNGQYLDSGLISTYSETSSNTNYIIGSRSMKLP